MNGAENGMEDRSALRPLTRLPFRRKEGRKEEARNLRP